MQRREVAEGLDLLGEIEDLLKRTKRILRKAEAEEKYGLALGAIREARGVYELLSRIAFSLHQARLAELEYEQTQDGSKSQQEEQEYVNQALDRLTEDEAELWCSLLEKIAGDRSDDIVPQRENQAWPDDSDAVYRTSGEEDEDDPVPPQRTKMRRTKANPLAIKRPDKPKARESNDALY